MTRLTVVGVLALAAVATGDAWRGASGERVNPPAREGKPREPVRLVRSAPAAFSAGGSFLRSRVLRNGREYLSAEAIAGAFPQLGGGAHDIAKIAVAPDGALVLAIYGFPPGGEARNALEFWHGRMLVGAFAVPPGYFGGGLAFNDDGSLVATFSHEGTLQGVFDRRGRRIPGLPDSFLYDD